MAAADRKRKTEAEREAARLAWYAALDREDAELRALIEQRERETTAAEKRRRAAEAIRKYGGPAAGLIVVVLGQPAADITHTIILGSIL